MPECDVASTGENIFKLIDSELEKRDISWDNCMSFGADNAMVMQGLKEGTAGYINKKNSAVYVLGCPCHLIHLAAEKAAAQLPVPIEELLVDVFFYLDKSSKRKQGLKEFQDLCGVEMRKIVKHVSTRWLSLEKCIGRLLQQWPALLQYFESEQSKFGHSSKTKSTQSTSKNKATHSRGSDMSTHSKEKPTHSGSSKVNSGFDLAGYLFRQQNLAKSSQATKRPAAATTQPKTAATRPKTCSTAATEANTLLQQDQPCIHVLHRTLTTQLKDLLNRFVKPEVINAAAEVQFSQPGNQKSNEALFIVHNTRTFIADHPELEELQLAKVYSAVRAFYVKAVEYMVKKFPYKDPVLLNASVADMSTRDSADFNSIRYFRGRFPCLRMNAEEMDKLEGQFMTYQTDVLPESITSCDRPDTQWHLMSQLKDGYGHLKYPLLCRVMLAILCIFHSNADCERIFRP